MKIFGYRVEWKPGDYCFYTVDDMLKEAKYVGFDTPVYGLYEEPQNGFSANIVVYKGQFWIEPRYSFKFDLTKYKSLYLGSI